MLAISSAGFAVGTAEVYRRELSKRAAIFMLVTMMSTLWKIASLDMRLLARKCILLMGSLFEAKDAYIEGARAD